MISDTSILLLTLGFAGAIIFATTFGGRATAVAAGILGLSIQPYAIFVLGGASIAATTIAPPTVGLYTNSAALLIAIILSGGLGTLRHIPPTIAIIPFAGLAVAVVQADLPAWVISGLLQWALFALAWGFGAAVAASIDAGRFSQRAFVVALALPVVAHAAAVARQLTGFGNVNVVAIGATSTISRVTGLAGHPGNLGKILILLLLMLLPFTKSSDRWTARVAYGSMILICATLALTFSRANVAAAVVLLGLWYVLGPGGSALNRFAAPLVIALAAFPVVDVLLERQAYDSEGGLRPELQQAALDQLHQTWLFGVGPNDYLPTVGRFDRFAAGGLPVHSTVLLVLVELGLVITALVAWPLLRIVLAALRNRRLQTLGGRQSAAVLAATPGLLVILWTGHGMISTTLGLLAFFTAGYVGQLVVAADRTETVATEPLVQPSFSTIDGDRRRSAATVPHRSGAPSGRSRWGASQQAAPAAPLEG